MNRRRPTECEISESLRLHKLWITSFGARGRMADLSKTDLVDVDMSNADLRTAMLWGADMSRANLTGSDLTNANLYCTRLVDAVLLGSNLAGAEFSHAIVVGCRIDAKSISTSVYPLSWWLEMGARVV